MNFLDIIAGPSIDLGTLRIFLGILVVVIVAVLVVRIRKNKDK